MRDGDQRYGGVLGKRVRDRAEVTAVPSAHCALHAAWVFNTLAGSLSSPGVDPGASVVTASNALMFDLNPQTGAPVAPPIGIGGAVAGRPVLIELVPTTPSGTTSLTFQRKTISSTPQIRIRAP